VPPGEVYRVEAPKGEFGIIVSDGANSLPLKIAPGICSLQAFTRYAVTCWPMRYGIGTRHRVGNRR